MAEPAHSLISASGFKAIRLCHGKLAMEKGKPDSTSQYAAWGTVAHDWAAQLLQSDPKLARAISYDEEVECEGFTIVKSEEMAECVNVYLGHVRDYLGDDGYLMVESRLNYSRYLGVRHDQAWGTGDAVILRGDEIIVIDLKTGMGVQVDAEQNDQMSLYGLGALDQFGDLGDFKRVRLVVSQPRINVKPSEWDCTVDELLAWAKDEAQPAAVAALLAIQAFKPGDLDWEATYLTPAEDSCRFCKAKATCPALRGVVHAEISAGGLTASTPDEFLDEVVMPGKDDTAAWLSASLKKVDLIEDWCKAIRAETERRMLAGEEVPDFKLVQGKRGNRQWEDAKAAEEMLKTFRLKQEQMYDLSLKSPTQIAKLGPKFDIDGNIVPPKPGEPEPVIGKRQWPKLKALITQKDGKTHVAPASDPRPAIQVTPAVDDFADVTADDIA